MTSALAAKETDRIVGPRKASDILAERLAMDPSQMISTIKAQCFAGSDPNRITNEQLGAFVAVANELELNPLIPGMLYAYPTKNGGIMPMIGPDGVYSKLYNNQDVKGWDTEPLLDESNKPVGCKAVIETKSKGRISYTALLSEWQIATNPNWKNRPLHMLGIRALKQAARQILHGLPYDEDERKIIEAQAVRVDPQQTGESKSDALYRQIEQSKQTATTPSPGESELPGETKQPEGEEDFFPYDDPTDPRD